jgi:hypothetical protein
MLSALRHTPFGVPVVPDVKVSLAVPSASARAPKVRRQNSPVVHNRSRAGRRQLRLGDHPFGLALLQTMGALGGAEERRQGQAGQAFKQHGQVPQHRVDAIVQRQGDHLRLSSRRRSWRYSTSAYSVA